MSSYEEALLNDKGSQDANGARVHYWLLMDQTTGKPSYVPKIARKSTINDNTTYNTGVRVTEDIAVIELDKLCMELGMESCLENWNLLCYHLEDREEKSNEE